MDVVADEEVRAAFFVPLRQPVPGGSRHKATTSYIMQTTASIQRTAHLRPLATIDFKTAVKAYVNAKSKSFTRICGFDITRREVIRVNLAFIAMIFGAAAAGTSLIITLICIALAGYNVYRLNVEGEDNRLNDEERIEMEKGGER